MKTLKCLSLLMVCLMFVAVFAFGSDSPLDVAKIQKITGMKGDLNEKEGVLKLSVPRNDLSVTVAGVRMTPSMGLTAWAGFTKSGDHVLVTGDIVLTEGQVNAVMSTALDGGLNVTALHNHFLGDSPKIMFMHIEGTGDEDRLGSAVRDVFEELKDSANLSFPQVSIDPANTTLDPKKIDSIMGVSGTLKDGVYKATFGRKSTLDNHEIGNAMGINTWTAYVGSDDQAVVDGDFAMLEGELQGVLKALRAANINIVSIHNHMSQESPKMVFLHFWGIGATVDLAKGIKAAMDTQNSR